MDSSTFYLPITDIHYSQLIIRHRFKDGRFISELCEDFLSGKVTVETIPKIPVIKDGDKWYAMDGNRRLFVMKKLYSRGMLDTDEIPVKKGFRGKVVRCSPDGGISINGFATIENDIDVMISEFEKYGCARQSAEDLFYKTLSGFRGKTDKNDDEDELNSLQSKLEKWSFP